MSELTAPADGAMAGRHPGDRPAPLVVEGLSAGYDRAVLTDFSLVAGVGETVHVVGPNAAGKSTLLRCLVGVQPMWTGSVAVCGLDLAADPVAAKRHLGFSAGSSPFTYLTGREHLRLAARVHGLGRASVDAVLGRFAMFAVTRSADDEVRRYSQGMRQQLALLLAVLHDPCLLVLDEAVDGLDQESLAAFAAYLNDRASQGGTLVYVEHRDEVVEQLPPARAVDIPSIPREV